jgi:hypothetical protein
MSQTFASGFSKASSVEASLRLPKHETLIVENAVRFLIEHLAVSLLSVFIFSTIKNKTGRSYRNFSIAGLKITCRDTPDREIFNSRGLKQLSISASRCHLMSFCDDLREGIEYDKQVIPA